MPIDDVAAMAAAMDRAAADPEARASIGRANRARVEREYAREACYRRYVDTYRAAERAPHIGRTPDKAEGRLPTPTHPWGQ